MLALTRKARQRIVIGNDVVVEILRINGDEVKLGITAPDGVPIDREEVRASKVKTGKYTTVRKDHS